MNPQAPPGSPPVLIISQYDLPINKRNMNAYQRILYGSEQAPIVLLLRKGRAVSDELRRCAQVHFAPVRNRWLFLLYCLWFAGRQRRRGLRYLLTEPSGFAAVGFLAQRLLGYRWALDVWDRPRWRTGQHEDGASPPLSDRLVFWIMRHADIFLLSVLPRAAKDIRPDPRRCIQLFNAMDQSLVADGPIVRPADDPTLHLAYGRSKFWDTMGLDVVIKAVEILQSRNCPVMIHLVGELPDSERRPIEESPAGQCFKIHGVVSCTRAELFRQLHAGLAPYPAYEDLSYIFPIKVLEHLSQGNPIVASNVPGIAFMVKHEENGLLFEPGNAEQAADCMERLQRDRALFDRLSRGALQSIAAFDVRRKHALIFGALRDPQPSPGFNTPAAEAATAPRA